MDIILRRIQNKKLP